MCSAWRCHERLASDDVLTQSCHSKSDVHADFALPQRQSSCCFRFAPGLPRLPGQPQCFRRYIRSWATSRFPSSMSRFIPFYSSESIAQLCWNWFLEMLVIFRHLIRIRETLSNSFWDSLKLFRLLSLLEVSREQFLIYSLFHDRKWRAVAAKGFQLGRRGWFQRLAESERNVDAVAASFRNCPMIHSMTAPWSIQCILFLTVFFLWDNIHAEFFTVKKVRYTNIFCNVIFIIF